MYRQTEQGTGEDNMVWTAKPIKKHIMVKVTAQKLKNLTKIANLGHLQANTFEPALGNRFSVARYKPIGTYN